jgi:glycosyltransferase involved in cell wall biosynthesis
MNYKISIIIPVFNTPEERFKECINSVINQTYRNIEVLVVDDGSDKRCATMIDEYCTKDDRIRVFHKENEGSAVARNIGVLNATGDYIMFVDSDDAIVEYCCQEATEILGKNQSDIIIGLVNRIKDNEIIDISNYNRNNNSTLIKIETKDELNALINHMLGLRSENYKFHNGYIADGPVAKVCKTEIAKQSLFSSESFWNDDTIWNLKLFAKCRNINITNNVWYIYHISETSKTRKYREKCLEEFKYRIKQEYDLVNELWPNCMEGIYHRIWSDTALLCRTLIFHPNNKRSNQYKYLIFKEAIHNETYRVMLKNINFKSESRYLRRVEKNILRNCLYYGPNYMGYMIWKIFCRRNPNM